MEPTPEQVAEARALVDDWRAIPAPRRAIARIIPAIARLIAERDQARLALWRVYMACGLQIEPTPSGLAGMNVSGVGDGCVRSIDSAWAKVRERNATIANDYGEGTPPGEGWAWRVENTEGTWKKAIGDRRADVNRLYRDAAAEKIARARWHWWIISGTYEEPVIHAQGWADTAREAMCDADAAGVWT